MSGFRVFASINTRYGVFDTSGQLPFGIVLGLCRRSAADTNPLPLFIDIAGSALDVPYALTHGLLILRERKIDEPKEWTIVDVSHLGKAPASKAKYLSLPSSAGRVSQYNDSFTEHHHSIDIDSELASILEVGRHYRIKFASSDLRLKRWAYGETNPFYPGNNAAVNNGFTRPEPPQLRFVPCGNASFTVVASLPWPPRVEVKLTWSSESNSLPHPTSPTASTDPDAPLSEAAEAAAVAVTAAAIEVTATNTGPHAITLQTGGHQSCLAPQTCVEPEPSLTWDHQTRILHASPRRPVTESLRVRHAAGSREVVRAARYSRIRPLTPGNLDRRPKREDLVVLEPGAQVVRRVDLGLRFKGLGDGEYIVSMDPRACGWWDGVVEVGEDGRLPRRLCRVGMPGLMLESTDEVMVRVRDGNVVGGG